ncbi:GIY-YIG nuclease family protein [Bosea sp. 124]|uniref:GIY-YIG nuclease family protein n=1 Tax=Bosea sp. 124 TaxID=2135642 RepID=UPI000D3437D2|nr:GIY-YIG nuclease family protein [Bosea sp. 124]PTM40616.1 T5orf172 domain-containing protein [Bosea sp. 124]
MNENNPYGFRRKSTGRHRIKQIDGVIIECSSRVAKSGSQAHWFKIGTEGYTLFAEDDLSPVVVGDRVQFDYEIRRYRSGSRQEYYAVIADTLTVLTPSQLGSPVSGSVYVLSNPSMPDLLKVGFTTGAVSKRAADLSGVTGVPTGFTIEWVQPVTGDARAVEQRAHAHLAAHRTGKEFYRVPLQVAKNAVISSFAELYPNEAMTMHQAFSERAAAELERRAKLVAIAARKAEHLRMADERKTYEASHKGQWRLHGIVEVVLRDFDQEPERRHPSLWTRLIGVKFEDYAEFNIEARQQADEIVWHFDALWRSREKGYGVTSQYASPDEAQTALLEKVERLCIRNYRATIKVPNKLIVNPPELPSNYRNPRVTLQIPSIDELIFRPEEIAPRRRR